MKLIRIHSEQGAANVSLSRTIPAIANMLVPWS